MRCTTVFLREQGGRYVYAFTCCCGVDGEIGVPRGSQKAVRHECGVIFKQALPTGIFGKPELLVIWEPKGKK